MLGKAKLPPQAEGLSPEARDLYSVAGYKSLGVNDRFKVETLVFNDHASDFFYR